MPMSSGGHVASSSECATKPKVREIGLTGYAVPTRRSLLIGHYVMATAEHREPCDSRGSCTVLGAPSGETPPGDSSFTTDAVEATRACMSAVARKRTSSRSSRYVRLVLPAQPVDATQALNFSAGVSNPRVLRGRSLSWRATLLRW